jgi:hypothetical protein
MRRSTGRRTAWVITIATSGLFVASPSHAYLDPGTGSIILQGLLAGVAVAIGVLRHYWEQCKSFLTNLKRESRDDNNSSDSELEQTSNTQTKS